MTTPTPTPSATRAREIYEDWRGHYDKLPGCKMSRMLAPNDRQDLIDAIATALASAEGPVCEHCGLPLTCNAELREDLEGHKAMLDENITERDKAKAHAEGLAKALRNAAARLHRELSCHARSPCAHYEFEDCPGIECTEFREPLTTWRAARGGGG